jgi:hypothetical protein
MAFDAIGGLGAHHAAELFEEHHTGFNGGVQGGQTVTEPTSPRDGQSWADSVGGSRCGAVHDHMSFAASQKSLDRIQAILDSPRGTPEQRQHAQAWLEQRKPKQGWLERMFSMVGLGPNQQGV